MVVAISRFTVSQTVAHNIEERFAQRPRLVDQHPGFLGCEVLKTGSDPVTFVLITRWESRAKLKTYLQSDDFRSVHAGNEEAGADFKVYDLIAR
jgi:heme oxygenase (mycobilin-producing)